MAKTHCGSCSKRLKTWERCMPMNSVTAGLHVSKRNSGLEGTSWWFLPRLSHRSPAQRLPGEALSFLLDLGGRLPEGLSHLLQETCSAWYKTTGWGLIPSGTNGNFDVHNSGLGCHSKACGQSKIKKGGRGHFFLYLTVSVRGAALPFWGQVGFWAVDRGLLHNDSSSNCALSFLNLHNTNQKNFDCFTVVNGY